MTNEINAIFMTLIESTLNKMIDARIEAKVGELNQRIEALEEHTKNATWAGSANSMATLSATERITALEEKMGGLTGASIVSLNGMTERIEALEEKTSGAMVTIDLQSEEFRNAVREIADEAVDEHCGEYDHDNIHEDEVDEDAMDTAVRQALKYAYIVLK